MREKVRPKQEQNKIEKRGVRDICCPRFLILFKIATARTKFSFKFRAFLIRLGGVRHSFPDPASSR